MTIQNIFSIIFILSLFIPDFSISSSLTPISVIFHKGYDFSLNEFSKFVVYSFKNEMDIDDDLVFRFDSFPKFSSKLYLYFSENDVSQNIETLISCNPYTGEFFGSFYNIDISEEKVNNYEIVVNSNECDSQYLISGYIYVVISLVSLEENPEYKSQIKIYNTKYMPELSISKLFEYYEIRGPYRKKITFIIPTISENTLLRLGFYSSIDYATYICIYQNNLNGNIFYNEQIDTTYTDKFINLTKGFSYYIKFYRNNNYHFKDKILFQFPKEQFIKLEQGKVIYTSSLSCKDYYYFYYDNTNMKAGDTLFLQISQSNNDADFRYKELTYNDYDYISQRKNTDNTQNCQVNYYESFQERIVKFYYISKTRESQVFLFLIKNNKIDINFPNFQIEIVSKKIITNPDEIQRNFRKGESACYSINFDLFSHINKNILMYSNENALHIYYNNFPYEDYSKKTYRNITRLKLYFLDPSNPEIEKTSDGDFSKYYTIFIYNPSFKDYYFDIKFIDKNIYFIKEFICTLEEKIKRKSFYNNRIPNKDIYQNIRFINGHAEDYFINFQELYGNFEAEMIILDNINLKTIDEFLNPDISLNKKYSLPLSDPSILGNSIFIHIKINSNKTNSSPLDHIVYYQNILKINYSLSERLTEGEQTFLFLEKGKPTFVHFLYKSYYENFNIEIKLLGKVNDYSINVKICEEKETILNNKNKIIRGRCKYTDEIKLINNGNSLTGVIIKRAIPKYRITNFFSGSLLEREYLNKELGIIKFEKGLKNLYYFLNEIYAYNSYISIYQEYSDFEYLAYPPKHSLVPKNEFLNSYNNLSVDYSIIYDEKSAKGKIIDSDYLYLIIYNSDVSFSFKRIFRLNHDDLETRDFIMEKNNDTYFFILPRKTLLNNFDSLFIQLFVDNYYHRVNLYIYKDSQYISHINSYEEINNCVNIFDKNEINEENELYLYIVNKEKYSFRYKIYNSKDSEFNNYNYLNNLIKNSYVLFTIEDKNNYPYKVQIIPSKPHEIKGCHNYYFFVLNPKNYLKINSYYDYLYLDSSVFYQNFTAKNVCSSNSRFHEKDIDKFTFEFKMKKKENITIFGYSEQIGIYNAINFIHAKEYYYDFDEYLNVNIELNNNLLFNLDEEIPEIAKYKIIVNNNGLLNIFWKGSNKNKIQDIEIYKNFNISPSNLIYQSLKISNFEHNFSLKVNKRSNYLLIYKSKNDENNRIIYFDFTHNLGKEFGLKNNEIDQFNYKSWTIYTSGSYKFYTKIVSSNLDFSNEFYAFRYRFKNNNYNSVSSIKLSYYNENENLIKSYEIKGNVNNKFIDSENHIFFYFMPGDNIKNMVEQHNLNYIQIEFKLKFENEGSQEALDELYVERFPIEKICDKNCNMNINNLIEENSGKLGIYYVNLDESIFELNQNVLFYSNVKDTSDFIFYGNILDFNINQENFPKYINKIEKQLFVFNEETIIKYITKNNENIILIILDGKKEHKKLYNDSAFFEFKFVDKKDISFKEDGNRSNTFKPEEIFSFQEYDCSNNKYFITYYPSLEKEKENIYFSKNIYGKIDIYYTNENMIFSDSIKEIKDILPDNNDKYLINNHPHEVGRGGLDILTISCKKAPALSIFYTFENEEQSEYISFSENCNTFIGYIFPKDSSQLEKKYFFEGMSNEGFISKLKTLKIIGFQDIDIKYKQNESEEYSEIREGQERIIESIEDNPSFKIDEDGIGKGIIFFEIIKGISLNQKKYDFIKETGFNYKLSPDKYIIFKYENTQEEFESEKIILFNDNDKEAKICVKYDYYNEPFIGLPDCKGYSIIPKNSNINIKINNPDETNKNLLSKNELYLYTILKSDSPIKFIYIYSNDQEDLSLNSLKNISGQGEFLFKLKEKSPEKKFFIYQINQCLPDKHLYLSFDSKIYHNFLNKTYGVQRKIDSNMLLSIIHENENYDNIGLYFVVGESDINNENIDELINENAEFDYKQEKNNIIFNIDNFAEEEYNYYSIITLYNNIDNLSDFCFFFEFYKNNNTLFSKTLSKGKGIKSKTIITHNINEGCFTQNCTILVFAVSEEKNISKIYTPRTLQILEKYELPSDSTVLQIIFYGTLIMIILVLITIVFYFNKRKKSKESMNNIINKINNKKNNLESDQNQQNKKLLESFFSINGDEENKLPDVSEIYKRTITSSDYEAPPTIDNII